MSEDLTIKEYLVKLFGNSKTKFTKVLDWEKWVVENNYLNRLKINDFLLNKFEIYGHTQNHLRMVHIWDRVLLIKDKGDDENTIELFLSSPSAKLCYVIPYNNEEDFENKEVTKEFFHGFIHAIDYNRINQDIIQQIFDIADEDNSPFKTYEADFKSWYFIDNVILNTVDMLPQLKMVFEDYLAVKFGDNIILTLPYGFIAVDKLKGLVIICSYTNHLVVKRSVKLFTVNDMPISIVNKIVNILSEKKDEALDDMDLEVEVFSCIQNKL